MEETLCAIRGRIETLATATGEYYVVCGRTGEQPVPVDGMRFPDRETASEAAQTATAYRAVLREYDSQAPVYDFIVCQDTESELRSAPSVDEQIQHREGGA